MRSPLRLAVVLGLGLLATPPAAAQDTAWPLYRNEKFGFELRHPPATIQDVRTSRTLRVSASGVKGFWSRAVPVSTTPWCPIVSAV